MDFLYRGRCWKYGDDVAVDGDMMPLDFALSRETRLEVLAPHAMGGIDPRFAADAQAGDLVIAGKRFAQGNPHIQGLLGLAAHRVGLLCESIPRGSFRNAVNAGLPLLPHCTGITALCDSGDRFEVDFRSGDVRNLTRGWQQQFEPLPALLLERIALGGFMPALARRLQAMGKVAVP